MTTFLLAILFLAVIYWIFKKPKEQIEYEQKLKESLDEEYIIDPETGARLTLEQAESGHWIKQENEHYEMPESEIEKLYSEEDKDMERAANLLKSDTKLKRTKLSEEQVACLENTVILKKYDNWSYHYCFYNSELDFYVFFPTIEIHQKVYTHYPDNFLETQIMYWINLKQNHGHYYLRQKSTFESIINQFTKDENTFLKDYVTLVDEPSNNALMLLQAIKQLEKIPDLEIEVLEENLFIKSRERVSVEFLEKLQAAVKNVC